MVYIKFSYIPKYFLILLFNLKKDMPAKTKYTALIVLQSEDQIPTFKSTKDSVKEYILKTDGKEWLATKTTSYDKFLSEDYEHTYDFVALVFPESFTLDDLEM